MYGGPSENVQRLYLCGRATCLGHIILEVWRRMQSMILITCWLMTLVHKVVTRQIKVLNVKMLKCPFNPM